MAGALFFAVGFIMLYLMKFDLLAGGFTLISLAVLDKHSECTVNHLSRNWGAGSLGNFAGALTIACFAYFLLTSGYNTDRGTGKHIAVHFAMSPIEGTCAPSVALFSSPPPLIYFTAETLESIVFQTVHLKK
jgi:formate/nitrite transporter FocA (FNT family)